MIQILLFSLSASILGAVLLLGEGAYSSFVVAGTGIVTVLFGLCLTKDYLIAHAEGKRLLSREQRDDFSSRSGAIGQAFAMRKRRQSLSYWTTAGELLGRLFEAFHQKHQITQWELEIAMRDIALRGGASAEPPESVAATPPIDRESLEFSSDERGDDHASSLVIDRFIAGLRGEFRHTAAVVTDGAQLWHSSGNLGSRFRRAFIAGLGQATTSKSDGDLVYRGLEIFGFRYHLSAQIRLFNRPVSIWLGYESKRPPTNLESVRLPLVARDLELKLSTLGERRAMADKVVEAEQKTKGQSRLIAEISHDIRSPLGNLKAILNILRLDGPSKDMPELLDVAANNCETLEEIVTALIDFSRVQSGTLSAVPEVVETTSLLQNIASSFQVAAKLKGLAYSVDLHPTPLPIEVDTRHLKRIVINLLSNAFKYTSEGSVAVRVGPSVAHGAKGSDAESCVCIEVVDTGKGMTEEQLQKLFTPFARFHSELAEGIGLGLTLTKSLVELNGGTLSVSSCVDSGSTFSLSFPRSRDALAALVELSKSATRPGEAIPQSLRTLLVVDDDKDSVDTLARVLSQRNFRVRRAYSVAEALAWLDSCRIDAIVSDSRMPHGGVGRILSYRDSVGGAIPTIVVSGDTTSSAELLKMGAVEVLSKPVPIDDLVRSIDLHLAKRPGRDSRDVAA